MFDNPLYDIYTSYPFIWSGGDFPEALKPVRDLRIVVVLPSTIEIPAALTYTLSLTSLTPSGGTVLLNLIGNDMTYEDSIQIPIMLSPGINLQSSFISIDQEPAATWTGNVSIHPDCLILLQEAPNIRMEATLSYDSRKGRKVNIIDVSANDVIEKGRTYRYGAAGNLIISGGVACVPGSYGDGILRVANGFNVTAEGDINADEVVISLDCGSENGLGIYRTTPWSNVGIPKFREVGLRDINGITGQVKILGDGSVNVETTSTTTLPSETIEQEEPVISGGVVNLIITGRNT